MKRSIAIAILAVASLCMGAAIGIFNLQASPAVQAPAEEVAEEPPVTIALLSSDEEFVKAVEEQAGDKYIVRQVSSAEEITPEDIVVSYMDEAPVPEGFEGPQIVFTDAPHDEEAGKLYALVDENAAVKAAWDALYTYPTHCAPIRMLALFTTADGMAYETYTEMLHQGKLWEKGVYFVDSTGVPSEEWTKEALDGVTVGLLDTIFAETAELAKAAYSALKEADRNDSVEVICPELDQELVELMIEDHWLMGAAVGGAASNAAASAIEMVEGLLENSETESVIIEPKVIYSDDVIALYKSGVTDVTEIMAELMK